MKFNFEDSELEMQIGKQICGLRRNNKRPISVTLEYSDITYLEQHPEYLVSIWTALYANSKGS